MESLVFTKDTAITVTLCLPNEWFDWLDIINNGALLAWTLLSIKCLCIIKWFNAVTCVFKWWSAYQKHTKKKFFHFIKPIWTRTIGYKLKWRFCSYCWVCLRKGWELRRKTSWGVVYTHSRNGPVSMITFMYWKILFVL